ncbi:hypothetical protein TNCV_4141161 [Trichonephila clavipes]|nr:hypothetical protein TNCV_4141161 [Trichonephila clavipes]
MYRLPNPSTVTIATQTDEIITKIVCPPLKLLKLLIPIPKPTMSSKIPTVIKSSTTTQGNLLSSTASARVTSPSESQPPISAIDTAPTTSNSLSISAASSSSTACSILQTTTALSNTIPPTSPDAKLTSPPKKT